jgi:hypothetical protein
MQKMTSAYANKVLRKLKEDKEFYINQENEGYRYVAGAGEEPVIPDYDFDMVTKEIREIDDKMVKVKHAINVSNSTNKIDVSGELMTIDEVLIRMAQLSARKTTLDNMRKQQPKTRLESSIGFGSKRTITEYRYINYDIDVVKAEYKRVDAQIAAMQIALDKYNQTVEFDVDI